jgi:hypothetical protein
MTYVFNPSASGRLLLCTPLQHLEALNACVLSLFRHSNPPTAARNNHVTPLLQVQLLISAGIATSAAQTEQSVPFETHHSNRSLQA